MTRFFYSGSFDPVTHGHLEIIRRAYHLCDELIVGVGTNPNKHPWFAVHERMAFIADATRSLKDMHIIEAPGLTADIARQYDVSALVRGVRSGTDFDREMQINQVNKELCCDVDTILFPADDFGFVSSSAVKEIAKLGATEYDLAKFVPGHVARALLKKVQQIKADKTVIETGATGTVTAIYHPDGR